MVLYEAELDRDRYAECDRNYDDRDNHSWRVNFGTSDKESSIFYGAPNTDCTADSSQQEKPDWHRLDLELARFSRFTPLSKSRH